MSERAPRLFGLLLLLLLSACQDRLPGFANPPPFDGGTAEDDGDDDAGR